MPSHRKFRNVTNRISTVAYVTNGSKKNELEGTLLVAVLDCKCGNQGSLRKRPDGSELIRNFLREGDKLVCSTCKSAGNEMVTIQVVRWADPDKDGQGPE